MSENTKQVLGAIGLVVIMFFALLLWKGLDVAILICAAYFACWLVPPLRFWKFLLWAFLKIMQLFGYTK